MSILVVDDSPVNRRVLEATLRVEGFREILGASSAEEAFKLLGVGPSQRPVYDVEVILMDVVMPGIDGFEACRRIKSTSHLADIPIIIVTAMSETESIEKAFDAGASDYLTRPISRVELHARLRMALAVRREQESRKARERELLAVTQQLEIANRKLTELTRTDGLTGVANRRHFDETIEVECRRLRRATHTLSAPTWLSLLMIDVDHFKAFNDAYGHPRGDVCLQMVATAIRHALLRPADVVARYGGEEFVVILPDTPADGAFNVAERIRAAVQHLGIVHARNTSASVVTVSVGAASSPTPESADLLASADAALYEAKRGGRNRVHVATCANRPVA